LSRQLDSAKEGYDLLDQKRQILVYELMSRLGRARDAERRLNEVLAPGPRGAPRRRPGRRIGRSRPRHAGVVFDHQVELSQQNLMGIRLPTVTALTADLSVQFGIGGTSAQTDTAMRRFIEVLPLLANWPNWRTPSSAWLASCARRSGAATRCPKCSSRITRKPSTISCRIWKNGNANPSSFRR
jgi:V/A-type H+/Na+-transporting ATPase subunit D